jgi:transposase
MMAKFVGGAAQAGYVDRVRGLDPGKCLVVPVDVGKRSAVALVANHHGEVVAEPVEFSLTMSGTTRLLNVVGEAESRTGAKSVRIGVEAAGHFHRALCWELDHRGFDVVELNPRSVKLARGQLGAMRLKTDVRDCFAMVELLTRGQGWPFHRHSDAIVAQQLWVAHRLRTLEASKRQRNQVHAVADLACPGLVDCFRSGLDAPTLRMLLSTVADPNALAGMNAEQLVAHAAEHGRRMLRPKAREVIAAAADAQCVSPCQRSTAEEILVREVAALEVLYEELAVCDHALAGLVEETPAAVLCTIPGVGILTASYYGAAIGDPHRFVNAGAAYRYSGLSPSSNDSAGRFRKPSISREGSVALRHAILTLGQGLSMHHPDFTAYKRRLIAEGKKPLVAAVAVGHRAHRLAFSMIRSQQPFDEHQWAVSVAKGRPVTTTEVIETT